VIAANGSDQTTEDATSIADSDVRHSANVTSTRQPPDGQFPRWIWGVYLFLFGASVPWYIREDAPLRLWFGLPHWVVISLAASFTVALFTAFVVLRLWPIQEPTD
jgi:hypothetical protein|tara:strand:+ start:216 stop:530 length:315 start_codon:yes stop_codon:yes gene_type:complete